MNEIYYSESHDSSSEKFSVYSDSKLGKNRYLFCRTTPTTNSKWGIFGLSSLENGNLVEIDIW
jgi:hypothetical protein